MGKSSPSPPPAPDYAGAAREQGAANEATARLQGRISNPNIIGPLGGQTVTWGTPKFDQSGYDSAMAAYQSKPKGNAPYERQFTTQDEDGSRFDQTGYQNAMNSYMSGNIAPTREQFTTNANADQATVTQTLTPQAQATLDAQQRVQRSLAGLGEQGISTAQNVLGNAFNPNLAGLQTSVGNAGQIPQTPDLSRYGQASGLQGQRLGDGRGNRPLTVEETTSMNNQDINNQNYSGKSARQPEPFFEYKRAENAPQSSNQPSGNLSQALQTLGKNAPPQMPPLYKSAQDQRGLGLTNAVQSATDKIPEYQQYQKMLANGMGNTPEGRTQMLAMQDILRQKQSALPEYQAFQNFSQGLGNAGQISQAPELSAYGMAGANVNAQPVNAGPQAGQYGMAGAGPQAGQYGYAGGGPGGGQYGMAGANVQAGAINQGPQTGQYGLASGALNTSNVAAMPVNAGMTGQQAIMNRLAPQLERSDAATRQRLINQGLVPGGEAYENAMISQNQQKNDLLSQAALQGIGLDTALNAQGFGQALQAGQYGNQAVAQNFSQAQAAQAAQNAAQQQGFAQQFGLAGLQNQAVGQNFGQGVTAQQLQNAGIGQNFAQGQAANAAGNQAVGQNFGQGLSAQQAQNAASQQLYNQYMGVQGLQNQAVNQNQQAALAQYQAQLGGQQQGFGQNVTQQQLGNQAIAQNQQAALQQQQAALAAQNQQYNQLLQGAQFGNTAQQQSLQQQLALRNQPLNEIAGLMSGSQIQMPQFQGYQGANVAGTPIFAGAQAAGQAAMDQYGIQSANVNAQNAGLYGMLGTAGGLAGRAFF